MCGYICVCVVCRCACAWVWVCTRVCVCVTFCYCNSTLHDNSVCYVSIHRNIMLLSNSVIYDLQLQAGSDTVATATLHVPHWSSTTPGAGEGTVGSIAEVKKTELPHWLHRALDPSHPVVFIDTDKVGGAGSGRGWKVGGAGRRADWRCIEVFSC